MALKLMYITNRKEIALIAEKYGVERIWVDLEVNGKEERQKGRDSVKSKHTIADIREIAPKLTKAEMLVRINPWYEKSEEEIENVINAGADMIMLPMWKTTYEVERFIGAVGGRCKTTLLLETKEAENCLERLIELKEAGNCHFDEVHIGLNDLHISYGLTFMFELLANGTVERICKKLAGTNIPYGFGGVAKIGEGTVPAENIIMEHYRLGSTRVILSRTFCDNLKCKDMNEIDFSFKCDIGRLRDYEDSLRFMSKDRFAENQEELKQKVVAAVGNMKIKK